MIPLVVGGWLAGWALATPRHRLPASAGAPPSTTVVVPARDEAARLPRLLAALAADPPDEVLVVDDGSTDDTAALAAAAGATVLAGAPPSGWTGKAAACQQGAEAATGDIVVFLDADTEPAPGFVRRLAATAAATAGLVSVQPWHRVERPYEHLSAACNVVAVLGAGTGGPGPRWWRGPVAFGPAVAVPRTTYLRAGGHTEAAGEVVDDLALAAAMDAAGVPVRALVDDGAGIRYRMYPEGVARLVEGWTKNLAAGAGRVPPLRSLLVALWVTGALVAITHPLAYLAFAVQFGVLYRRAGGFAWPTFVLWPVPLLAFVGMFGVSAARRVLRRPGRWRGRELPA